MTSRSPWTIGTPMTNRISDGLSQQSSPLFAIDFTPTALLYPTPSLSTCMNYREGVCRRGLIWRLTISIKHLFDDILSNPDTSTPFSPLYHGSNTMTILLRLLPLWPTVPPWSIMGSRVGRPIHSQSGYVAGDPPELP
jgi:hypothetical protein